MRNRINFPLSQEILRTQIELRGLQKLRSSKFELSAEAIAEIAGNALHVIQILDMLS